MHWNRVHAMQLLLCLLLTAVEARPATQTPAAHSEARRASPEWATLVGSAERSKYHRLTCGIAQNIKAENVIWFVDANDATENGYSPAGCNDKKCRPPAPDSGTAAGPIGGSAFPAPNLNPPEIPKLAAMPGPKAKKQAGQQKGVVAKLVPPPRMAQQRNVDSGLAWQGVAPQQELASRKKWDVWAAWALERWCDRWHVSPSGKIAMNAAYTPDAEKQLMARFAGMKDMIDQNKKRMAELEATILGKKK